MNTKQLTWPTIQEQQKFWINKETVSENATNETREDLPDTDPFREVCHSPCLIGQHQIVMLLGHAAHVACLEASKSTTADPKPEDDDLSRTEATTEWFDGLADTHWSLRDEGCNPDGSGLSYGERNA